MHAEHVLLVDDEMDFVEALQARLEARGLVVEIARDGTEAVAKVSSARFDAVVMDLAMPGMDGIETLRALKRLDPDLQVMLLTGRATVEKSVQAIKLGAIDFLEKPVDINILLERIREAKTKTDAAEEGRTRRLVDDILKTKGW